MLVFLSERKKMWDLVVDCVFLCLYAVVCCRFKTPHQFSLRKPPVLVVQLYNLLQIAINAWIFLLCWRLLEYQGSWHLWPLASPNIWLVNMPPHSGEMHIHRFYRLSRYFDWFDTVILILQHKALDRLHTFHHGSLPLYTSMTILLNAVMPGPAFTFMLNCGVHVLMYAYFFGTLRGGKFARVLKSWKGFLTFIQCAQFVLIIIQCTMALFLQDPEVTKLSNTVILFQLAYVLVMLLLFLDWSLRHYMTKDSTLASKCT
jgi:hypothetical protein